MNQNYRFKNPVPIGELAKIYLKNIEKKIMKTLHLNLKRKWFLMILEGVKKEEYREIKPHWINRLIYFNISVHHSEQEEIWEEAHGYPKDSEQTFYDLLINGKIHLKPFKSVTFSNGMAKDAPRFEIEFKGFEINEGKSEWGAKEGKRYFVLKLGEIISRNENALKLLNQAA